MADTKATIELIEARMFIEVGAVELAVSRATEREIRQMGTLVKDMTKMLKAGDANGYTEKNVAFHFLIAKASQNRFMTHLLATIRGYMEQWMLESITVLPGLLERSLKSHRAIYLAIRDRDRRSAVACMTKHIHDLQGSFKRYRQMADKSGATISEPHQYDISE
jgi:GntR family transcriptional repressor for pyruvate dehydrogenase complex